MSLQHCRCPLNIKRAIDNQISYLNSKEFYRLDFVEAVFGTLSLFGFGSNQEETMPSSKKHKNSCLPRPQNKLETKMRYRMIALARLTEDRGGKDVRVQFKIRSSLA
jgi:hypothetical protein